MVTQKKTGIAMLMSDKVDFMSELQGHFYILRTWETLHEFPPCEHLLTAHANFLKEIKDGLRGFFPN